MMKKIYQVSIILIFVTLLFAIHNKSFALTQQTNSQNSMYKSSIRVATSMSLNKLKSDAEGFLNAADTSGDKIDQESIKNMITSIYGILAVLGTIATVIVGIILAIKFITGGLEEQAKIKEMLIPYVVGCVVIFSAFSIWKIVVDLMQSMQ